MYYLRYMLILSCSILLSACGDSYPTAGSFSGGGSATVFSLTSEELTAWQNEGVKLNNLSSIPEGDLLSITNNFIASKSIKPYLTKNSLLLNDNLNLDSQVEIKRQEIEKFIEKLSNKIFELEKGKTELEERKARSEKANTELKKSLSAIDKEEKDISLEYDRLNLEYVKFFSPYTSRKAGAEYDKVNKRFKKKLFSYDTMPTKVASCKAPQLLYATPIKVDNYYFCAYFIPIGAGSSKTQKISYIASLTSHEKSTLRKLADLNFKKNNMRRYIKSRVKEVEEKNKSLVSIAKSFTYRDEKQLKNVDRTITQLNSQLSSAKAIDDIEIKQQLIVLVKQEIAKVQPYYLHEKLINSLTKVSDVQVDGSFKLPTGNDFYLIESQSRVFENNKYALLRMNHFKNLEVAKVEANNLFSFKELSSLKL